MNAFLATPFAFRFAVPATAPRVVADVLCRSMPALARSPRR